MASEKPGPGGLEPQPVGLVAVGAGGGGGGGSGMGEARGPPAPGAVVLPAGMINPSVPIRNIRMKFAVLIGLIQVGEVSNRDIVETVLNLVRENACPCLPAPPPPAPRVTALRIPASRDRAAGGAGGDPPARSPRPATSPPPRVFSCRRSAVAN